MGSDQLGSLGFVSESLAACFTYFGSVMCEELSQCLWMVASFTLCMFKWGGVWIRLCRWPNANSVGCGLMRVGVLCGIGSCTWWEGVKRKDQGNEGYVVVGT
jgi:hypothetical protein